jgi:thioredoxin-related protein
MHPRKWLRHWVAAALLTSSSAGVPTLAADVPHRLESPPSHEAVLRDSARDRVVVVAMFTLPGCPFCEAIRRDQLRHLARDQADRGLRLVEYDLTDRKPFTGSGARAESPASPAALAASLGIRLAPTVVFLGPDGGELAERLVGYSSPDFYGAYLEQRIAQARSRLAGR